MSDPNEPRIIARVPFVDGVTRDVYEEADGRQWFIGYEREKVYAVWLVPPDEPVVVEGAAVSANPRDAERPWERPGAPQGL
jgi:hypothetical protein